MNPSRGIRTFFGADVVAVHVSERAGASHWRASLALRATRPDGTTNAASDSLRESEARWSLY